MSVERDLLVGEEGADNTHLENCNTDFDFFEDDDYYDYLPDQPELVMEGVTLNGETIPLDYEE